jgi:hypothetical protein
LEWTLRHSDKCAKPAADLRKEAAPMILGLQR